MLALETVQELVLERCRPLEVIEVQLTDALGCVLAEDVVVEGDVPPFANTAMDGYAVRSADTVGAPVELRVVGVLPAGQAPPTEPVAEGEALQIMTGAPMPAGADAVVMVERTAPGARPGTVRIDVAVDPDTNVRPAGSDYADGALALASGTVLGPTHLGVLATAGRARVRVWRRPRVGVMSTGDELVEGDGALEPGQIRDSNRLVLLGCLRRDGFDAVDLGIVRDTKEDVERALNAARTACDAVLSSGGVSKGEFDYVKGVLDDLAAEGGGESFELAVRIRPAKPLALAWLPRSGDGGTGSDRVAFFGLPGNPVSSMVSYQVIALPGLRRMGGLADALPAPVPAIAAEPLPGSRDGRLHLARVDVRFGAEGRLEARSAGGQGSHQLSGASGANGLAMVEPEGIAAGGDVKVLLLTPPTSGSPTRTP